MYTPYTICPAVTSDAKDILALQKTAYQSEAVLYNDWTIPPLTQSLDALIAEFSDHTILKAFTGEQHIAGSVRGHSEGETCMIGRLMVHPAHQRQGLGAALVEHIEHCFPAVSRYTLFTGHRSESNIRLYRKLGYSISHTQRLSAAVSLIHMEKRVHRTL